MTISGRRPFANPAVAAVFNSYPGAVKETLLRLRRLIFETALNIEGVGGLEETLKWGQPSYLTTASKSGTTLRIDRVRSDPARVAIYVNCQTDLVATFRNLYPDLDYEANRAIRLAADDPLPEEALRHCISLALTYHARKHGRRQDAIGSIPPSRPRP